MTLRASQLTVSRLPSISFQFNTYNVAVQASSVCQASATSPMAELLNRLNEDRTECFAIPFESAPESDFLLSTPRLKLTCKFSSDGRMIVTRVQENTVPRWRQDAKKNTSFRVAYTWVQTGGDADVCALLRKTVDQRAKGSADPNSFWQFWRQYLWKEQERIDRVKESPGWSYRSRRWGFGFGAEAEGRCIIDFEVNDDQEDILSKCDSRILIAVDRKGPEPEFIPFQLQTPAGPRWITASPMNERLRLDQVPKFGLLKPDHWSLSTEFRRRKDALNLLERGLTAMPHLNALLPDGPTEDGATCSFNPKVRTDYNNEQHQAIAKALNAGSISCILGPPGTGKTAVISEIASQIAAQGGRVLISSQSNLAVDNALERVIDSDDVFRVRVGRPEAVRFNRELLFERASERFRSKILEKSRRAFEEEESKYSQISGLPDGQTLETLIEATENLSRLRDRLGTR